jgi:hypothetical protein
MYSFISSPNRYGQKTLEPRCQSASAHSLSDVIKAPAQPGGSSVGQKEKAREPSAPPCKVQQYPIPTDLDPLDIILKQKELQECIKTHIKAFTVAKTPHARFVVCKAAVSELGLSRGVGIMKEKAAEFDRQLNELKEFSVACDELECSKLDGMRSNIDAKVSTLKIIGEDLRKLVEVVEHHMTECRAVKKKNYYKARYCKSKISDLLIAGECSDKIAFNVAKSIVDGAGDCVDSSDLAELCVLTFCIGDTSIWIVEKITDPCKPAVITSKEGEMEKFVAAVIDKSVMTVDAAYEKLTRVLTKEETWMGCATKVDSVTHRIDATDALGQQLDYMTDAGAEPWMLALRPGAWRTKPAKVPLPGVCQVMRSMNRVVHVLLVPSALLLVEGINLSEVEEHLKTKKGGEFFIDNCLIVNLKPLEMLFVPFGYLAIPMFFRVSDDSEDLDPLAYVWIMPLFVKEWREKCASNLIQSVRAFNLATLRAKTGSMWRARLEVFEKAFPE